MAATQTGRLVCLGDLNIQWNCESDPEQVWHFSLLCFFDLVQHVYGPTYNDGHTIDLVITCAEDNLVSSCDIWEFVSDYNAIIVSLNCCKTHPTRKSIIQKSQVT